MTPLPNMHIVSNSKADDNRRSHLDLTDGPIRNDKKNTGKYMNFENKLLDITGYQAFVNLTDHKIGNLKVFLKELRAQFRGIQGQNVNITSLHGYIYYDAW